MPTLDDAIALAVRAHRGQVDKEGEPYITHVLRVMLRLDDETARIVAMLHDVVEDSTVSMADLRQAGYGEDICAAVECLTRRPAELYEDMISRVAENPLARRVKLADLEDNLDPRRISPGDAKAPERIARYATARERLLRSESDEASSR